MHITIDHAAVGTHDQLVVSLVRELLANVAKHSGATMANVELTQSGHVLILEVSDNGRGFTADQQLAALRAGHIGLASVRERVEASGGTFEVFSPTGAGTRVRCTIPIPAPSHRPSRPTAVEEREAPAAAERPRRPADRLTSDR